MRKGTSAELMRTLRLAKSLVTSFRHPPYKSRLHRLGGDHRVRTDLIIAFKIFTGLLDVDPNLSSFPPT